MLRFLLFLFALQTASAQVTKRVLFIGNSYTSVNNLPLLCASVAASTGNTIVYDSSTPDGHTLEGHFYNTVTTAKIQAGNWDFVTLQEQSQRPSFPDHTLGYMVYEYTTLLNNKILQSNPCAETAFYMTWGRKNGDSQICPQFPPVCTYEGMDDRIRNCYMTMTNDNAAIVSPVGAVWRHIRTNHPELELYAADGSHPSLLGSYVAACTFYTTLFRNDPLPITFDAGLPPDVAAIVKNAVRTIVYDHLPDWKIGNYDVQAGYTFTASGADYTFANTSAYAQSFLWDFGDGQTSEDANPTHTFTASGNYTVTLTAENCGQSSVQQQTITVLGLKDWKNTQTRVYPNPVSDRLFIESESENLHFKIYNLMGQLLLESHIKSKQSIDVSGFAQGIYFLKVQTDSAETIRQILKK